MPDPPVEEGPKVGRAVPTNLGHSLTFIEKRPLGAALTAIGCAWALRVFMIAIGQTDAKLPIDWTAEVFSFHAGLDTFVLGLLVAAIGLVLWRPLDD